MGQHKYNPTAQKAKRGELPPKPKRMGTAEWRRKASALVREKTGIDALVRAGGVRQDY